MLPRIIRGQNISFFSVIKTVIIIKNSNFYSVGIQFE